ncbi:MAG: GTPase, partial [bacterium]
MTLRTMRGDRLHIGFFGRRNAGKSSLINTLTGQNVAIVSETPGTTTDPVYKSMELSPLGPVVCIDTAGIDDKDDNLGKERIKRAEKILQRTDLALLIIDASMHDIKFEKTLVEKFSEHKIPWIGIINKIDSSAPNPVLISWFDEIGKKPVLTSSLKKKGIDLLKKKIIKTAPENW